jgi:hypothetical protein
MSRLADPGRYFDWLVVCWADGSWERFPTTFKHSRPLYKAELVIGIDDLGRSSIIKNRYGKEN